MKRIYLLFCAYTGSSAFGFNNLLDDSSNSFPSDSPSQSSDSFDSFVIEDGFEDLSSGNFSFFSLKWWSLDDKKEDMGDSSDFSFQDLSSGNCSLFKFEMMILRCREGGYDRIYWSTDFYRF